MSINRPPADRSSARYRQLIDCARDFAILSLDLDGRVQLWSAGAEQVFGWSEEDMLGESADCIFLAEERAQGVPERERRTAFEQGRASDERWHLRKDGERFWASGELSSVRDDQERVVGFIKILIDRTEHKQAELRLRELNQQLERKVAERTRERDRLWRNSLDLLLVIDGAGFLRAVNPAWSSALGYREQDLVDRHFSEFVHPDDLESTARAVAHAMEAPLVRFEVRVRHAGGSFRWFAWSAASEDALIYANGRDITLEKRQAEELLSTNQARLRLALETGGMGAWEWDMRSDEVVFLQGTDRLHGLESHEGVRVLPSLQAYLDFVHPEDLPAVQQAMEQARSGTREMRVEYRIRHGDGTQHWLEARGTVYLDEGGGPWRMLGVSVNITRRKRVERDLEFLARASAELAGLVEPQTTLDRLATLAVPGFADWCSIDMVTEEGNLERLAVAHVEPEKVQLARDVYQRFPPDRNQLHGAWNVVRTGQPDLVAEVREALLDKVIADPEYRQVLRELGLRSYMGVPLSAHGRTLGVVTFISAESGRLYDEADLRLAADLARRTAVAIENAHLYRALQQSDQGKDVFLATLAHELRNPLAAIANGLGILKLAPGDVRRVEHAGAIMDRQVNQLRRLVDDLMDVSRIATGKIELRRDDCDLVSIINHAIETTRPLIEAAHHQLTVALPGGAMRLHADPVRLTQVFANLLNNAAKYTHEGGHLHVAMEAEPEEFIVRVRDDGIGIAPELLASIFTIFRQGSHPLERSHGGLGIGLSLVEGLVRLHGGRVEAHSEGAGRGSEFVVTLPRGEHGLEAEQISGQEVTPGGQPRRRVLVVDDNVDAANTVGELLQLLGHQVHIVHDGVAAVSATRRLRPDVVLLDIGLPGIDGYEAARRIRESEGRRRSRLVALTGWGQEQDRERAYEAGFDEHCVKPIGLEQLRKLLET